MEFSSALSYAKVRDFAYHDRHPLHYGARANGSADRRGVEEEEDGDEDGEGEDGVGAAYPEGDAEGVPVEALRQTPDDIYRRAVALFDFEPENSNETRLVGGQVVWISYRHGQGWLVAENLETGETGLVPEEYVQVLPEDENEWEDEHGSGEHDDNDDDDDDDEDVLTPVEGRSSSAPRDHEPPM